MSSIGNSPDPSVGGSGSIGAGGSHNDDPDVTHARGRIDDMVRHLGQIRDRLTPESTAAVGGLLDDADKAIEKALDALLADEV